MVVCQTAQFTKFADRKRIEATIARVALGPALLALAGRWNWWPGSMHTAIVANNKH
jgi:hypothetical protein